MSALHKYLRDHAEVDIALLQTNAGWPLFQQALVIPIYREAADIIARFAHFAEQHPGTLLVLIINRPDTDTATAWADTFFADPRLDADQLAWQSTNRQLRLYTLAHHSGLLLLDRCLHGPAIPADQGVGLARKVGADIVCTLIAQGKVQSPWIANTDADAILPADYFSALHTVDQCAAVVYPFTHIFADNDYLLPTLLYEYSLHYYVQGLQWAASPYAFHTVGSTIAVHYQHYAMVRGFPKRAGAEDFYLLNKLAKTGAICSLRSPRIELQARLSNRVPFGTGPAVSKLTTSESPLSMPLYHPDSFLYLQFFLQLLQRLTSNPSNNKADTIVSSAQQLWAESATSIDLKLLMSIIDQIKLPAALDHCHAHGRDSASRMRHLQQWFDGFKTLKFIHQLRDRQLGTIPFNQWLHGSAAYAFSMDATLQGLIAQIKQQHPLD